jgi:DNA-directed RNA polymerase specialized sigma24 family protein
MDASSQGSVSGWLEELKKGHEAAAQELWNRYFSHLIRLARHHLHGIGRDVDEEDIALSALKSTLLGVQNDRFPDLSDRTGLWPLLVTITIRKANNEVKRQLTRKRARAAEEPIADVPRFVGNDPSPEFALQVAEAIETLVVALGDETLRTIARRKLEGYSNEEIALELNVSTRTVGRKLQRIRQEWQEADQ